MEHHELVSIDIRLVLFGPAIRFVSVRFNLTLTSHADLCLRGRCDQWPRHRPQSGAERLTFF